MTEEEYMSAEIQLPLILEKLVKEAGELAGNIRRDDFFMYKKSRVCNLQTLTDRLNALPEPEVADGKIRLRTS